MMNNPQHPKQPLVWILSIAIVLSGIVALTDAATPDKEASGQPTVSGPRQVLASLGIDADRFAALADGKPWTPADQEVLLRILYRMPWIPLSDIQRWAKTPDLARLTDDPGAHRGEVYRLQGRTVAVEVLRVSPEMASRLDLPAYFRVELKLPDGRQAIVYARQGPHTWKTHPPSDQLAGALGFFLKLGADANGKSVPIFVAPRIAWYAGTLLGSLGMDQGLLEEVWQEEDAGGPEGPGSAAKIDVGRLRLTSRDRQAFYQMLAAVGRAAPGQLLDDAELSLRKANRTSDSVVPLFNNPKTQLGRLVLLAGTARRIVPIQIDDQDLVAQLGFDHYFELYLFTDDSQENPLVFCVRQLPPGMPTGEGPEFREYARVAGFFFKTWAYRRADSSSPGKMQWQLAPLLIGREPVWLPQTDRTSPHGGLIAGTLLLIFAGFLLMVWLYRRSDRRRGQPAGGSQATWSPPTSDEVPRPQHEPDFNGLAEIDSQQAPEIDDPGGPRP